MAIEDWEAMCELALDLDFLDAMKFIRRESGHSLIDSSNIAINLALNDPKTKIGQSYRLFLESCPK